MNNKSAFVLIFFLSLYYSLFAQFHTMEVYDIATKTYHEILPVAINNSINFDQTSYSYCTMPGKTDLLLSVPTSNLYPGAMFTDFARADDFYDLIDYPVRTAIKLFYYRGDKS